MDEFTINVTGVAHGGFAVGRHQGQVVFISGAIPGEVVRVRVTRAAKRHLFAAVTKVLEASPDRRTHVWPDAAERGVGGADLGHVELAGQRRWKAAVIHDALQRVGHLDVAPVTVQALSDGSHGTRTRVRFVADPAGRPAMRRPRSHETVPLRDMPLAVDSIRELELFGPAWAKAFAPGRDIRVVAPSASPPIVVVGDGAWSAPGVRAERQIHERVAWQGHTFNYRLSARGFWQVHQAAPARLVSEVMAAAQLTGRERVVELFSGAGLLTAPLATAAAHVTAVELDKHAVAAARHQLPAGVELVQAAVAPAHITQDTDVVVMDPPRSGAGAQISNRLIQAAPARVVYVACDPVALARDLGALRSAYRIDSLVALDMFEHTHHVECVVSLVRRAES